MRELLVGDIILIVLGVLSAGCTIAAIIIYMIAKKQAFNDERHEKTDGKETASLPIKSGRIRVYARRPRRYMLARRKMDTVKRNDVEMVFFPIVEVEKKPINDKVTKNTKENVKKEVSTEE